MFGKLRQIQAVVLEDEIDLIGQTYQDIAVAGVSTRAQMALFLDAWPRMVHDFGAEAVLLAGTDLNLAFDGQAPGYPVIDALDVHMALLADLATDRAPLPEPGLLNP